MSDSLPGRSGDRAVRLGYLVPEFPGQTHIFFWREIQALQSLGCPVQLLSTRKPAANIMSHTWSAQALAQTQYLFPLSVVQALWAVYTLLSASPKRLMAVWTTLVGLQGESLAGKCRAALLALMGAHLKRLAQRQGLTHVHGHSCANVAYVLLFSKLLGGPTYSLTLHGPLKDYGAGQLAKWQLADLGIVVSQRLLAEVRQSMPQLPLAKLQVAPMGVDGQRFHRRAPCDRARNGPRSLFSCGRLHPTKGHHVLVQTVRLLLDMGHDVRLSIAGEGPQRQDLQSLIDFLGLGERVQLLGAVSEDGVIDALSQADVFCLASHEEALGVAIMEAMAMQVPVVATDVGGVSELVRDGRDGLLVPAHDAPAMASAIADVLSHPERAQAMGQQGRERVLAQFTPLHSARIIARQVWGQTAAQGLSAQDRFTP